MLGEGLVENTTSVKSNKMGYTCIEQTGPDNVVSALPVTFDPWNNPSEVGSLIVPFRDEETETVNLPKFT